MGFHEEDARLAMSRTSSVEAAVELIMMKSPDGVMPERAERGWYGVMERVSEIRAPSDVYNQLPSRGTLYAGLERVAERVPSAGGEIYGAARRLSEHITAFVPPLRGKEEVWEPAAAPTLEDAAGDVASDLLALGFTHEQAESAAKRCSSVDAAVEWIENNPNLYSGSGMTSL